MATFLHHLAAAAIVGLSLVQLAVSQPFIGVNYGKFADNLPPPEATARLLQTTTISKLRLYGVNPPLIRALAGTGISMMVGTSNGDIVALAGDPAFAANWVNENVAAFMPDSTISDVSVGNEVLFTNDANLISQLVPAMQNVHAALVARPLTASVKVSTVHAMPILSQSDPPSSGAFNPDYVDTLAAVLAFLNRTSSTFMVNPYPYFAYQGDPRPETLAFCLFQENPGRRDAGTGVTYMNMFDAQVDAVRAAVRRAGFEGVPVVVAETGWPYQGGQGEVGATVENAKAYVGNLVKHLKGMAGTPVETYIFELYDENLKAGAESEKYFGLYKPDGTMNYDAGLVKAAPPAPVASPATAASSPPPAMAATSASPPTVQGNPSPSPTTDRRGHTEVQQRSHSPPVMMHPNDANLDHRLSMLQLIVVMALLMTDILLLVEITPLSSPNCK